ncbi:zinc finger MYM-type protein 6-like [Diabrotica undecimpunctata]|uniref:zinc finger MYM-type protein 6-like n=1 Tax=Diabrotica undecimpunctata TaxID=50387 RepID=UPI003B63C078
MGANVEYVLCNKLKSREFTVQLDESTLSDSTALLQYVRFIDDNGEMAEEILFVRSLITDTKRSSTFEVIKRFFEEKEISVLNMIACATDGTAAMTGRHMGFIAHLKQAVPGILCVHCIIHREHLAVKNLSGRLHDSLRLVIDASNDSVTFEQFMNIQKEEEDEEEIEEGLTVQVDIQEYESDLNT